MRIFRRIMLGSGGIDIDALPDTQKLYYKATAKVVPESNSLGVPIITNKWNSTTGEGIIVCSSDITTINNYAFKEKSALTSITIPDRVTKIENSVFYGCGNLTNITIPESVTSIGDSAFYYCSKLTSVDLGNGVTSIGDYAFEGSHSLTEITIPEGVTSIGYNAFNYCLKLTSVYCKPTTPPAGNPYMFSNTASRLKIYVPMNSVDAYKAAQYWGDYADAIQSYEIQQVTINLSDESKTYDYDRGMTWEEWVNSDYNTAGIVIERDYIMFNEGFVSSNDGFVRTYDTIVSGSYFVSYVE